MKYLLMAILLVSPLTDLDKIAKINELKKEAKKAFTSGDYQSAVKHYTYLLDSMQVEDENISLNLANAYYQLKDSANAVNNYNSLTDSKDQVIKSVAHQQLGIMADRAKKFDAALEHFKNAIRANPKNDDARYNYEMLKKMLEEQKKKDQNKDNKDKQDQDKEDQDKEDQQKQDQKNKDQQNKDQKDKENQSEQEQQKQEQNKEGEQKDEQQKDQQQKNGEKEKEQENKEQQQQNPQEGEESDEKKGQEEQLNSLSEKLKEMNISEEKAKMILEALKNNEIQYIQQNKRRPTKRKDTNKPDW